MKQPKGSLTAHQYEIMQTVWSAGPEGVAATAIWEGICTRRSVTRTTVVNQVERLHRRGWLVRREEGGLIRYTAAVSRQQAVQLLAGEFLDDFFDGSASELVASLQGSRRLKAAEIQRLRALLDSTKTRGDRTDKP
jgi:predicted transcriptional regulator